MPQRNIQAPQFGPAGSLNTPVALPTAAQFPGLQTGRSNGVGLGSPSIPSGPVSTPGSLTSNAQPFGFPGQFGAVPPRPAQAYPSMAYPNMGAPVGLPPPRLPQARPRVNNTNRPIPYGRPMIPTAYQRNPRGY